MKNEILLIISYLIGSIPFGVIFTKLAGIKNIQEHGSGNIGATNVARVAGKKLGALTLIADGLKGVAAVYLAKIYGNDIKVLAVIAVILGHVFPIWLRFRGGKGVITSMMAVSVCDYRMSIFLCICWMLTFKFTRISSLAAILSFLLLPIFTYFISYSYFHLSLIVSMIVLLKHSSNIRRLIRGEEKRIILDQKKKHNF